jgi:ribosomal protein S12 methylthiotransferase
LEDLVREAQALEARGVKELNLISQDTTWYGKDLRRAAIADSRGVGRTASIVENPAKTPLLPDLLRALLSGTTIPWFRLFYMYPSGITDEVVDLLATQPRLLPYLDLPIQHGSDGVLKRMRRPERRDSIHERVKRLREAIPDLVLRTTVIVGFPGETEEEFQEMLDLLSEIRFDRVGAFPYSLEEGTVAAELPGHHSEAEKRDRLETLMEQQREISFEKNETQIGRREVLLVDRKVSDDPEHVAEGRTRGQALEVDGLTRVLPGGELRPGDFLEVEIVDALDFDLIAQVVA